MKPGVKGRRKVCVFTGTRAEYGLLKPVMEEILISDSLELQVVASGTHLLPEYGNTVDLIRADGIRVDAAVHMLLMDDTKSAMATSMGLGIVRLTAAFDQLNPEIVVVLGDRFEALSAAVAAVYTGRVLAHISGGDSLGGGFDEYTRHAITKLAQVHFPSTRESAERVRKLGERKQHIHTVGSTSLDVIRALRPAFPGRDEVLGKYRLDPSRPLALVVYHPVTIGGEEGLENLLAAVVDSGCSLVMTYPNADPGSRKVIEELVRFRGSGAGESRSALVQSLPQKEYFSVMNVADFMIGNSSSGIIEAPYFGIPSIQVGSRQVGRQSAENTLFSGTGYDEIREAIDRALHDRAFRKKAKTCVNPYGGGGASKKIVKVLEDLVLDKDLLRKKITY